MKILIILIRMKGGVGRVALALKKELESRGHEVTIIPRDEYFEHIDLPYDRYKAIRNFVRKEGKNYDMIYTQDWSCAFPLLYPTRLFKEKHFCCFHGHNPKGLARFLQTRVGKKMKGNLFVVGDSLRRRFPKANLNHNGVDTKEFYDMKKKREHLGWIKRDYDVIDEEGIRTLATKKGLILSMAEDIPPEKMNEWYNSLKVFVSFPPEYTGFNLCWLEAKAAGVPVILGNENGIGLSNVVDTPLEDFSWKNHVDNLLDGFEWGKLK